MASEPINAGHGDAALPTDTVTVRVFSSLNAAELAAANLRARGIECWMETDDCGGMLAPMVISRGAKLLVRPSDAESAKALLDAEAPATESPAPDEPVPSEASRRASVSDRRLSLGQFAVGIVLSVLACLLFQWIAKLGTKTYRYDTDGDGRSDEVWIFKNGRVIEASYDRNFDGRSDFWHYYNSNGNLNLSKADDNFDGVVDATWSYANGLRRSSQFDTDFNGTPDVTYTYKHDLLQQADWRPNGANSVTLRQFFRHGDLAEEWRDSNHDGTFDVRIEYDAFQNPIRTNAFRLPPPSSK